MRVIATRPHHDHSIGYISAFRPPATFPAPVRPPRSPVPVRWAGSPCLVPARSAARYLRYPSRPPAAFSSSRPVRRPPLWTLLVQPAFPVPAKLSAYPIFHDLPAGLVTLQLSWCSEPHRKWYISNLKSPLSYTKTGVALTGCGRARYFGYVQLCGWSADRRVKCPAGMEYRRGWSGWPGSSVRGDGGSERDEVVGGDEVVDVGWSAGRGWSGRRRGRAVGGGEVSRGVELCFGAG